MIFRGGALALSLVLLAAAPDPITMMKAQNIPGMELVVVDHGKIVTNAAYGVKNLASQAPVDVHTRFEIGSITKQFTAAAILQLKERGRLSLDDRLGKYVPEYAEGRAITLRQLLLQISGVPDYTDMKAFNALIVPQGSSLVISRNGSFKDILAMLRGKPLNFSPGTKWRYSNSNYILLGRVVEVASGVPWSKYITKHVFAPAEMSESSFMENESEIADMATGYIKMKGQTYATSSFKGWALSAGTIVSTASDLAKWDAALFGGRIISAADVQLMTAPGTLPAGSANSRYGFGWVVDSYDGQPRIWHNGGTLGFSASNQIYPTQGQTVIALVNTAAANADTVASTTFDQLHPELAALQNIPVSGEDPAVTARAKALWAQFASGTVDRSQFTDSMNKALTPELIAGAKAHFATFGDATTWVYRGKKSAAAETTYTYRVTFSTGLALNVYMAVNNAGKISGYIASPN